MQNHLHSSSILFALIMSILTTSIFVPTVRCQETRPYDVCNQSFMCGNIEFDYPFWGLARPPYCGHPGFQVTCLSNVPILVYESVNYRVLDTDMSTNTITIARNDLWSDLCPNLLYNTTYNPRVFNGDKFGQQNVSIYYECDTGSRPGGKSSSNDSRMSCHTNSTQISSKVVNGYNEYVVSISSECSDNYSIPYGKLLGNNHQISCNSSSTQNDGYLTYFYRTDQKTISFLDDECKNHIIVPVNQSSAERLASSNATESDLRSAVTSGFKLEWMANNNLCDECMRSNGTCGSTHNLFACYCANGNFSLNCYDIDTSQSSEGSKASTSSKAASMSKLAIGLTCGIVGIMLIFGITYKTWGLWGTPKYADHQIEVFIQNYGSLAPKRYSYTEIKKMTKGFLEKLGQGGYGSVFKGELPNGKLVAVKLLSDASGDGEDFINEVATIGRTSHVNIVTLLGFCYEGKKRALMYEFMPNGSLDKFLRGDGSRLDWNTLFMIAKGIARGLEYLHQGCNTRIVHFDIKPHNILLDEEFVPKISDFGLAKLCKRKESIMSVMGARGTTGYMAPEVFFRSLGGASHKSDVYSYGMMVLEMTGGRNNNPVGTTSASEAYFPDWIYKQVEMRGSLGDYGVTSEEEEELARKMMIVSLWCIQSDPFDRPSIGKVVELLEGSIESLQVPPRRFWSSPQGTSPLEMQWSTSKSRLTVQAVGEDLSA